MLEAWRVDRGSGAVAWLERKHAAQMGDRQRAQGRRAGAKHDPGIRTTCDAATYIHSAGTSRIQSMSSIGRATVIVLAMRFAAICGPRQVELLPLTWDQCLVDEVRIKRGKQGIDW